jgi:hypothetical protein
MRLISVLIVTIFIERINLLFLVGYLYMDLIFNNLHWVSANGLRAGRRGGFTGTNIKAAGMERTLNLARFDVAFGKRSLHVRTGIVDSVKVPVDIKYRNYAILNVGFFTPIVRDFGRLANRK